MKGARGRTNCLQSGGSLVAILGGACSCCRALATGGDIRVVGLLRCHFEGGDGARDGSVRITREMLEQVLGEKIQAASISGSLAGS